MDIDPMKPTLYPTQFLPESFDGVFFVTIRLQGALPESFSQNLGLQYYTQQVKNAHQTDSKAQLHLARKRLFARFDQTLDLEKFGLSHLREPGLAQVLANEILRLDGLSYHLFAWSILPNHAHLLFQLTSPEPAQYPPDDLECLPCPPLRDIITRIQNATDQALRKGVKNLGRDLNPSIFQKQSPSGLVPLNEKIWHDRSFDFQIKDAAEFEKVARFIIQNPVNAELVDDWKDWPFSFLKNGS
jgi:putative transposase